MIEIELDRNVASVLDKSTDVIYLYIEESGIEQNIIVHYMLLWNHSEYE